MNISSPIKLIRENRSMYLGKEEPSGRVLAVRLADCALISGAHEVRFEVIVAAFSQDLSVKSGMRWSTLEGDAPPQEIRDLVAKNEFAVVFRAEFDS